MWKLERRSGLKKGGWGEISRLCDIGLHIELHTFGMTGATMVLVGLQDRSSTMAAIL